MSELAQAIARGWCAAKNSHKEMDADLVEAIEAEVTAMLRAQPAAVPDGWQQIETAPKDGTNILCAWFTPRADGTRDYDSPMHVLAWRDGWRDDGSGAWVLDGDWAVHFVPSQWHENPPMLYGDPTHWHPLPQPPAAHPDIADAARVIAWANDPQRQRANTAFTAGPERQAAYWIEWAESRMKENDRRVR